MVTSTENCSCNVEYTPWSGLHTHIVVTGASRGFGRAICMQLIRAMTKQPCAAASITILIMARNGDGLRETKELILSSRQSGSSTELEVIIGQPCADLADADADLFATILTPLFTKSATHPNNWNLLVHNAGSLGNLQLRADERTSLNQLTQYYNANLFSPIILTSVFLNHFAPFGVTKHSPVMIVNIGSLAAVKPMSHMSDYCVGKAARQMYFQTLSVDRPSVMVFNYSPGPLNTDMFAELAERHGDPKSQALCANLRQSGGLVEPRESARVCVAWVRRFDPYTDESGSVSTVRICEQHQPAYKDLATGIRIDYFDAVQTATID